MRLPISDQKQRRPYLAPSSHSTSVTDRQTDGRTTTKTTARPLLKYGRQANKTERKLHTRLLFHFI